MTDNETRTARTRPALGRRELLQLGTVATLGCWASSASADGLVVIVHPGVNETPSVDELAAIFTTRKQTWGGGKRIVPFNFPPKDTERVSFDRAVLGMNPDDVARYWIDRRIRGGNPPPKQVPNGRLIVKLVEKLEGAIGYVPASYSSGAVRVLRSV